MSADPGVDVLYALRIVDGPVAVACWVLGAAGAAALVTLSAAPAPRRWGQILARIAAAVVVTVVVVAILHWLLIDALNVLPEDIPVEVLAASGSGILGVVLATAVIVRLGHAPRAWGRRVTAVVSAAAMLLLAAQLVNAYFGLNLTFGDLAGASVTQVRPLEDALKRAAAPSVPL